MILAALMCFGISVNAQNIGDECITTNNERGTVQKATITHTTTSNNNNTSNTTTSIGANASVGVGGTSVGANTSASSGNSQSSGTTTSKAVVTEGKACVSNEVEGAIKMSPVPRKR